jgi:hypothetical protein
MVLHDVSQLSHVTDSIMQLVSFPCSEDSEFESAYTSLGYSGFTSAFEGNIWKNTLK